MFFCFFIAHNFHESSQVEPFIANKLKRSISTVTREINKWVRNPGEKYNADLAHWFAEDDYLNSRNLDKIGTYGRLNIYAYKSLIKGWLRNKFPDASNRIIRMIR